MYFKNEISSWDDIRVFQSVAEAGGLAAAAQKTGISAPTLGRRILRLERELNLELFRKHQAGYSLTLAGEEFLHYTRKMQVAATSIDRWRNGLSRKNTVKISAGSWTAWFLTSHLHKISQLSSDFRIELLTDVGYVDLIRREANIGIRNKPPKQAGLACKKLVTVDFAIYGASDLHISPDIYHDWSTLKQYHWIGSSLPTPSARWVEENIETPFIFSSTNVHLILKAAEAGIGLCVLPCFVGDTAQKLSRVSSYIPNLRHDQWLVSHDEDRHFPAIRNIIDGLIKLWSDHKEIFSDHKY